MNSYRNTTALLERIIEEKEIKEENIKYHITDNNISIIRSGKEPLIITRKSREDIFNTLKRSLIEDQGEVTKKIIDNLKDKSWVDKLQSLLDIDKKGNVLLKGRNLDIEEQNLVKTLFNMIESQYGAWGIKPLLAFYDKVEKNPNLKVKKELYKAVLGKDFSITQEGWVIAYRRSKWESNILVKQNGGELTEQQLRETFNRGNLEYKLGSYYKSRDSKGSLLGSFRVVTDSTFCTDEGQIYDNAINPEYITEVKRVTKEVNNESIYSFYLRATEFLPISALNGTISNEDTNKIWKVELNTKERGGILVRNPYTEEGAMQELNDLLLLGNVKQSDDEIGITILEQC